MKNGQIVNNVITAINEMLSENPPLLAGASERSFAHRIAVHMEPLFNEWNIDCEYNRHGLLTKNLEGVRVCDPQRRTDRIYPDIIVHKRTNAGQYNEGDNLLVIEVKLDTESDPCDTCKLELMTFNNGDYRYQLGLYLNIRNEGDSKRSWYLNGSIISEVTLLSQD
jgi:hypothetical protein